VPPTGVVHQHLPHRPGGYPQEMGPVFGADRAAGELEIGLVDQGRRLQGVPPHFPPEDAIGGLPKFLIDKGKEAVQRFPVAATQLIKKP
jgi:hypothetical protein